MLTNSEIADELRSAGRFPGTGILRKVIERLEELDDPSDEDEEYDEDDDDEEENEYEADDGQPVVTGFGDEPSGPVGFADEPQPPAGPVGFAD